MPRPKGIPKTGGRRIGTPNKLTASVREKLERYNLDPIAALARMARDAELRGDFGLAVRCYEKLSGYLHRPDGRVNSVGIQNDEQPNLGLSRINERLIRAEQRIIERHHLNHSDMKKYLAEIEQHKPNVASEVRDALKRIQKWSDPLQAAVINCMTEGNVALRPVGNQFADESNENTKQENHFQN